MNYIKYLIIISSYIIFLFLWYFFIYSSVLNYIDFYKSKISELEKVKSKSVDLQQECPVIEKEINKLNKKIESNLDNFKNSYNNINKIIKYILKNNLDLKECKPIKSIKFKNFSKENFKLIFQGQFLDIYKLFKDLLKIDCFCRLTLCKLKKEAGKIKCEIILTFILV